MRSAAFSFLAGVLLALGLIFAPVAHADSGPTDRKCRVLLFNVASPGNATNIIAKDTTGATVTGITATQGVGCFRVTILLATTSVLDLTATDGTTTFAGKINNGTQITGGSWTTFVVGASSLAPLQDQNASPTPIKWNLQLETTGVVQYLEVDEINTGSL